MSPTGLIINTEEFFVVFWWLANNFLVHYHHFSHVHELQMDALCSLFYKNVQANVHNVHVHNSCTSLTFVSVSVRVMFILWQRCWVTDVELRQMKSLSIVPHNRFFVYCPYNPPAWRRSHCGVCQQDWATHSDKTPKLTHCDSQPIDLHLEDKLADNNGWRN